MSETVQARCPICGAEARIDSYWLKDPEASVFERVVITRWIPCGHESSSTPTGPVRPDEEQA